MSKGYYILVILGVILLICGIIVSLKTEDCYSKNPRELFESRVCKWLVKE